MSAQGSPVRKLTTLTLTQKGRVINAIENGDKKTDVASLNEHSDFKYFACMCTCTPDEKKNILLSYRVIDSSQMEINLLFMLHFEHVTSCVPLCVLL